MAKQAEETNAEEAVIQIAKKVSKGDPKEPVTLESGVRVYVKPITAALIDQVSSRIKDPDPPMWYNEAKDRDEPNYSDPRYIKALSDAERERGIAAMDAIMMFGFELADGVPENKLWIRKLAMLDVEVDEDDEIAVEFAYKKYVAVAPDEISLVTDRSGISQEELQAAEASFRSEA